MSKFKHSYIDVSSYRIRDLVNLIKKFQEVTGHPLESFLSEDHDLHVVDPLLEERIGTGWKYLVVQNDIADYFEISVMTNLGGFVNLSKMTEITESNLDEELGTSESLQKTYPDKPFMMMVGDMSRYEKKLLNEWLVNVAKFNNWEYNEGYLDMSVRTVSVFCATNVEEKAIYLNYAGSFSLSDLPEIELSFSKPSIEGYIEKPSIEVLKLEKEIDKMKDQLALKEAELTKLK